MNITLKDIGFFFVVAIFSLANMRYTVGLPLENHEDVINAICAGIVQGVIGLIMYRANPEQAITSLFKRTPKP